MKWSKFIIEVEEIELKNVILPDDGIGMVIMQPFIELCKYEPYRWRDDKKSKQIERIIRTLKIAKKADHGCEKTHFTVFPEYAIPGLEGVGKIQEILESSEWESGTIVIGGVDGLTKSEYSALCSQDNIEEHQENKSDKVRDEQWINCCITWVKEASDILKRWVQPKLIPAAQEEICSASHMFEGKAVYVFRPKISIQNSELPFRFLSFICKDWIGNRGSSNIVDTVLSKIDEKIKRNPDRLDIYLCFVLERNPDPDYPLFLQRTVQYLNENMSTSIRRSDGAVLFINSAGKNGPGYCEKFGKSGFVFHPNCSFVSHKKCCPPTYSLKARKGMATCKEARFRERGACIMSIKFLPPIPAIVRRIPATPIIPINPAIVHSVDAFMEVIDDDPRTPGKEVPASVKWVNDQLDRIVPVLGNKYPLKENIARTHQDVSDEIGRQPPQKLCKYIEISSSEIEKEREKKWVDFDRKIPNIDNWDENERKALETVVYSLSITKTCKPLKVSNSPAHATLKTPSKVIDIIVVSGKSHEDCFKYAKNRYNGGGERFVIVVTHDGKSSLSVNYRDSIYDVRYESSRGPNIADPDSRLYHCGYQNLIDACFHSQSLEELDGKLSEIMGV